MSEKNFGLKKFWVKKNVGSKKSFGSKKLFGKHNLCVTNRVLVCSVIVDFGGVPLVVLVLPVIWVFGPLTP